MRFPPKLLFICLERLQNIIGVFLHFCFILGSGASREGGIPTGVKMAKIWAEELKNKYEETELQNLMKKLDIKSITPTSENYFGI
jgi:hypothetical protein